MRLSGRVCTNYAWTEAKCVAGQELNGNCESSKCTFLAFVVVVESGSLSSDMLIVGRDVAGLDGPGLISNGEGRHWDVHQVLGDGLARFERGQTRIFLSQTSGTEVDTIHWHDISIVTISVNNHFHSFQLELHSCRSYGSPSYSGKSELQTEIILKMGL